MKNIIVEYYEVTCPDGGGMRNESVAKFTSFADADSVAKRLTKEKKWPYSAQSYSTSKKFNIFETAQEYFVLSDEIKIREAALAKLTEKERKALGI
jgi:hypothetical protein